jgi:stage II sporulation protein D
MNPSWAAGAEAGLYKNMADIYGNYIGDSAAFSTFYEKYRACAPQGAALQIENRRLAVEQTMPQKIRVLVADSTAPVRISGQGAVKSIAPRKGAALATGSPVLFAADNSSLIINGATRAPAPVRIEPEGGQILSVDGSPYPGLLVVTALRGHLLVVNHIPLDEYLCGVLPREMAPSWPLEALKAQAVAARTYAVYHMLLRRTAAYDVLSTTSSQVYGGSEKDYPAVRSAVDATRGLVLAEGGRLALTLFHANSGGRTESLEDIWGGRLSYLSSVDDPFSKNYSGGTWEKTLSAEEIASACAQFGIAADKVKEIVPIERSASGRIKKLKVVADSQTFFLSGNSFRLIVGPGKVKGTNFAVQKEKAEFVFKGTGYGHGAGMSQWGAYGMSKKGHDFTAILGHYYPGAQTVRIVK